MESLHYLPCHEAVLRRVYGMNNVFPESMNQLPDDPKQAIEVMEKYIRYMCERIDFALTAGQVQSVSGDVQSVNGQTGVVNLGADDIPFDNTGTTISSTYTESAIKEVYRNAGTKVIPTTMANYLAHKSEYDATDNMYQIDDAGVANTAGNVSFDDTIAQIGKNNVQGAIEKNSADIGTINSNLSTNSFGNPIELSSYSQSSPYIVPQDGYVGAYSRTGEAGWVYIIGGDNTSSIFIGADATADSSCCTFVRKGMKLWANKTGNAETRFYPLV